MATVLIADDDAASRMLVVTLLRYAGHEALEASDGDTALAIAERKNPDLIITDLSMPGISGADVIRRLRQKSKTIAIALYTATPPNAAIRAFMDMYAVVTLIPKPSEPDAFLSALRTALIAAALDERAAD